MEKKQLKKYTAELWNDRRFALGECPNYVPSLGRYSWVDIINGELWILDQGGDLRSFSLGQPIGAAVPVKDSEALILAAMDGLYKFEKGGAKLIHSMKDAYAPYQRSNDAKSDPAGRLWFGSSAIDDDHEPCGDLYRFSDGKAVIMQENTQIANGMAWRSDNKEFYFSDSVYRAVFAYDYDLVTGNISGRRELFKIEDGVPDGMCIDTDDNLWVAVWGGNRVEKRSGATGELLAVIEVPAVQTTSCCFGGENMDTLIITSAAVGQTGEYDGCLFRCRVDARGKAPDGVMI